MTRTELDEYVRRIVATAPPLTPRQRDRLSFFLRPLQDASERRAGEVGITDAQTDEDLPSRAIEEMF